MFFVPRLRRWIHRSPGPGRILLAAFAGLLVYILVFFALFIVYRSILHAFPGRFASGTFAELMLMVVTVFTSIVGGSWIALRLAPAPATVLAIALLLIGVNYGAVTIYDMAATQTVVVIVLVNSLVPLLTWLPVRWRLRRLRRVHRATEAALLS